MDMSWVCQAGTSEKNWLAGQGWLQINLNDTCGGRQIIGIPTVAYGTAEHFAALANRIDTASKEMPVLYVTAFNPRGSSYYERECARLLGIQQDRLFRADYVQRRDHITPQTFGSNVHAFNLINQMGEVSPRMHEHMIRKAAEKDLDPSKPLHASIKKLEEHAGGALMVQTCRDGEAELFLTEVCVLIARMADFLINPGSKLMIVVPAGDLIGVARIFELSGYERTSVPLNLVPLPAQ